MIKDRLSKLRRSDKKNVQVIAFVAPTKILVTQQRRYISGNTDAVVLSYTGESKSFEGRIIDDWNVNEWAREISQTEVMVFTPEVLRQLLEKQCLLVTSFDCIILDECHHAFKNDPMAIIRSKFYSHKTYKPRILGMTASPLPCKKGSVANKIAQLELTTGCELVAPKSTLHELRRFVPVPEFYLLKYGKEAKNVFDCSVTELITDYSKLLSKIVPLNGKLYIRHQPTSVLLHAYARLRHATYVSEMYDLLRTLRCEPTELPELEGLDLPTVSQWHAIRSPPTAPQTGPSRAGLSFLEARSSLFELQQLVCQLFFILEDTGVLCALHAFRHALDPVSEISRIVSMTSLSTPRPRRKRPNRVLYSASGTVDSAHILAMKAELLQGDYYYCYYPTLLS